MERNTRRFTVGDAMILVAANAMALGLQRIPLDQTRPFEILPDYFETPEGGWEVRVVMLRIAEFTIWPVIPVLAAWTVALLALRLRGPRPSRRRLGRLPGAMAAILGTIAVGCATALGVVMALTFDPDLERGFVRTVDLGSILAGAMILGGWIAIAVGGRWRPEPTWLDRTGRVLGVSWIVAGLVGIYYLNGAL
jgi:hypothetical protein